MRRVNPSSSALLGVVALWAAGCQKEASVAAKATLPGDAQAAAAVGPAAVAGAGTAPAEPKRDPFVDPLGAATVELSGAVVFPPGARPPGRLSVFVARGDCLDPAVMPLRRMPATEDGAFLLHTLSAPGTELSVCAALETGSSPTDAGSSVFYGQAATRVRIEKTDDLVIHDVQIPLRSGPPRRFVVPPKLVKP